jgi:apolipoprotein D and lipocalin family protein
MQRRSILWFVALALAGSSFARAAEPLRPAARPVNLQRFMGDWYVVGFIPVDTVLGSDASAHNALQSYRLGTDGRIASTYSFRRGSFTASVTTAHSTATVSDKASSAVWSVTFLWPFKSTSVVVHVDDAYETTVVGVPDRSHVWLMARRPDVPEAKYAELVAIAARAGFDTSLIRRVPHLWSGREQAERGIGAIGSSAR